MVPTTVLAQQHYERFTERFKNYPVSIEILSRLKSEKEQKEVLKKISAGTIDIVIGTHRILSSDVKFKDLGLVVIDEEQKFGVKAKEQLKKLKNKNRYDNPYSDTYSKNIEPFIVGNKRSFCNRYTSRRKKAY